MVESRTHANNILGMLDLERKVRVNLQNLNRADNTGLMAVYVCLEVSISKTRIKARLLFFLQYVKQTSTGKQYNAACHKTLKTMILLKEMFR